jgi:hypothetical protein
MGMGGLRSRIENESAAGNGGKEGETLVVGERGVETAWTAVDNDDRHSPDGDAGIFQNVFDREARTSLNRELRLASLRGGGKMGVESNVNHPWSPRL